MNQQIALEIATILHHEWSVAFQIELAVKAEKDDGSPDWHGFHQDRLDNAKLRTNRAFELREAFKAEHPINLDELWK